MSQPSAQELEEFQAALTRVLGLRIEPERHTFLHGLLRRRLAATGLSCARYLSHLELARTASEVGALMRELAVSETSFFRNRPQFEAFAAVALPDRLAASTWQRPLTILSAGCASGEEPYSLAMVARDIVGPDRPISVIAIDANPTAACSSACTRRGTSRAPAWDSRLSTRSCSATAAGFGRTAPSTRARRSVSRCRASPHGHRLAGRGVPSPRAGELP